MGKSALDKNLFNKISTHPLQTWEWGEFRREWGNTVTSIIYKERGKTTSALLTLHKIPLTKYKVGAVLKGPKPSKTLLHELSIIGKEENCLFIKLEPNVRKDKKLETFLKKAGCVPGKTLFTPTTFWIDLTKSEEELLKSFNSKTRYNIRLAERRGVRVSEDNSKKAFEKYIELTRKTVERQGFYAHSEKYHRLMWKHLHTDMAKKEQKPIARLLTAKYTPPSHKATEGRGGEIISTWIVFVWKDSLYYPYGASSDKYKNVMANNAMMWEAIRYGKRLKLKKFDLWGREPGKGFTKFKEGYSPEIIEFAGTWDFPISPLYKVFIVADKLRWAFLRLRTKLAPSRPSF